MMPPVKATSAALWAAAGLGDAAADVVGVAGDPVLVEAEAARAAAASTAAPPAASRVVRKSSSLASCIPQLSGRSTATRVKGLAWGAVVTGLRPPGGLGGDGPALGVVRDCHVCTSVQSLRTRAPS